MTKAEANRSNAQNSTGPTTETGKSRSSRNALSHGLQGADAVLAHENVEHYREIRSHYESQCDPADVEQRLLADQIIQAQWRLRRAQRLLRLYHDLEVNGWSEQDPSPDEIILRNMDNRGTDVPAIFFRHEAHFQRLWWRILKQLERLREPLSMGTLLAGCIPRNTLPPAPAEQTCKAVPDPTDDSTVITTCRALPKRAQLRLLEDVAKGQWKPHAKRLVQEVLRMPLSERARVRNTLQLEIRQTKPSAAAA